MTLTPPPSDLPAIIRQLRLQIEESYRRHLGGVPVVGALTDVTNPLTGQLVILSTINILYRYDGAAWKAVVPLGGSTAATRHSATYTHTTSVNIPNAGATTPLPYQTANRPSNDVVASGVGNTTFTFQRGGSWTIAAGFRYAGNAGGGIRSIVIRSGANDVLENGSFPGGSPVNLSIALTDYFTSGTAITIQTWQNCGAALATDIGNPSSCRLTFTYHGQEE